jgi:hypothetical protein
LRRIYTNDKIRSIVEDNLSPPFILEVGNKLIRKTTPIYATPEVPENPLNFRTFLYAPEKYFAGFFFDTYWFNMVIIWLTTFIAIVILYMDLLKKFLRLINKFGDYRFRKKIKQEELPVRK